MTRTLEALSGVVLLGVVFAGLPAGAYLALRVGQAEEAPFVVPGEVPVGTILAFWGLETEVPENWEVCDGTGVKTKEATLKGPKPDLRDHFLQGAPLARSYRPRAYKAGGQNTGNFAGTTSMTSLTPAQIPGHSHDIPDHQHRIGQTHTHDITATGVTLPEGTSMTLRGYLVPTGTTTTTANTTFVTDDDAGGVATTNTGGGGGHDHGISLASIDTRPRFFEVLFIIRVK